MLLAAQHDDVEVLPATTERDVLDVIDAIGGALDVLVLEVDVDEWSVAGLVQQVREVCPALRVIGLHPGRRSDRRDRQGRPHRPARPLRLGWDGPVRRDAGRGPCPSRRPSWTAGCYPGREVLTPREREVLRHISAGLTTQQSAQLLEVSPKTVDNHKQRMFAKLGVQNQAHAVAVAHRCGILGAGHREASGA